MGGGYEIRLGKRVRWGLAVWIFGSPGGVGGVGGMGNGSRDAAALGRYAAEGGAGVHRESIEVLKRPPGPHRATSENSSASSAANWMTSSIADDSDSVGLVGQFSN